MHQKTEGSLLKVSNKLEKKHQPYPSDLPKSIAIVGCGASGVATLASLVERIRGSQYQKYKISIFEKSSNFGSGLAYQCDSDDLLMNMVSSTISIFDNRETDFWEWVINRGHHIGSDHVMAKLGVSPDGYISRQFFGLYLRDRLDDAISDAENANISVTLVNHEVIDIQIRDGSFYIYDCARGIGRFDYVILCIGNTEPNDIFGLNGKNQYINNPYPVNRYAKTIKKSDCVGIIGGQLTAADIAVVLANQGHTGPIHFFTRDSNYPLVRCTKANFELKNFTLENLELIKIATHGEISLRQALRLARKDFARVGIQWNRFFKPIEASFGDWIKHLILNGSQYASWQSFAVASDAVIANYWHALDASNKAVFMDKYHRLWMCKRVPLPVHTCLKLHSLFQSGILNHHSRLLGIRVNAGNKFIASISWDRALGNQTEVACDWMINSTGPSRSIDFEVNSSLVKNLLKSGLIRVNPFGGIEIDFETSQIVSGGKKVEKMYAIGQLTSGAYYFVSSLDMVSSKAKRVAYHLINSSQKSKVFRTFFDNELPENAI